MKRFSGERINHVIRSAERPKSHRIKCAHSKIKNDNNLRGTTMSCELHHGKRSTPPSTTYATPPSTPITTTSKHSTTSTPSSSMSHVCRLVTKDTRTPPVQRSRKSRGDLAVYPNKRPRNAILLRPPK